MDEPAKTLGDTTSEEHDCVRELWWAATGCYFSEDSLDKAEKASIAFLHSRSLRVIDPAKVMVLERRENYPTEPGKYLVMQSLGSPGWTVTVIEKLGGYLIIDDAQNLSCTSWEYYVHVHCIGVRPMIFQLPPTEGR